MKSSTFYSAVLIHTVQTNELTEPATLELIDCYQFFTHT